MGCVCVLKWDSSLVLVNCIPYCMFCSELILLEKVAVRSEMLPFTAILTLPQGKRFHIRGILLWI